MSHDDRPALENKNSGIVTLRFLFKETELKADIADGVLFSLNVLNEGVEIRYRPRLVAYHFSTVPPESVDAGDGGFVSGSPKPVDNDVSLCAEIVNLPEQRKENFLRRGMLNFDLSNYAKPAYDVGTG